MKTIGKMGSYVWMIFGHAPLCCDKIPLKWCSQKIDWSWNDLMDSKIWVGFFTFEYFLIKNISFENYWNFSNSFNKKTYNYIETWLLKIALRLSHFKTKIEFIFFKNRLISHQKTSKPPKFSQKPKSLPHNDSFI